MVVSLPLPPRTNRFLVAFLIIALFAPALLVADSATEAAAAPGREAQVKATVVEQLIPRRAFGWHYNDSLRDLGTSWRDPGYPAPSNLGWQIGRARFANDCCETLLDIDPYENSTYFLKEFQVTDVHQLTAMDIDFQYDDAAILWINGVEVYRSIRENLPATGEVGHTYDVQHGGLEDTYVQIPGNNLVEYAPSLGYNKYTFVPAITPQVLTEGNNVVAIQLWNRRGSTDTSTDLSLHVTRDTDIPPPTGPPVDMLPFTEVTSSATCLNNDGRIDIDITNVDANVHTFNATIGNLSRSIELLPSATGRISVTGRQDGMINIDVSSGNTDLSTEQHEITCDPQIEVAHGTSCVAQNGRVDVHLDNITSVTATYEVRVGAVGPRYAALIPGAERRISVTGRADGPLPVVVMRDGVTISSDMLTIDCDPDVETRFVQSCLAGNGRIDVHLDNTNNQTTTYQVSLTNMSPRNRTLAVGEQQRVTWTGRPDGNYVAQVTANGAVVNSYSFTVIC